MRPLAGRGKRHSGLPLRAFSRAGVLQSRKARRFCQDAHDLREAPSQKLRAPVLQASESYLRPPELLQQGNWPKGQPNGTQWTGVFGLGLKGSLESSLRLPKLAQRVDGHEIETDLATRTY